MGDGGVSGRARKIPETACRSGSANHRAIKSRSYDKALAITNYLRLNISYSASIPAIPEGQDPVMWVLFELEAGLLQLLCLGGGTAAPIDWDPGAAGGGLCAGRIH